MIIEAPDRDPRRRLSLQVCDHREPLVELRRLLVVFCAYQLMDEGDAAIASGEVDYAVELYKRAISLVPDNLECRYWYAVSLLNCGRSDDGNNIMREIYAADSRWQQLSPRLVDAGLLTELTPR
jgi:predicted Zn-dependent protease